MLSQYQPKILRSIIDLHKSKNGYDHKNHIEIPSLFRITVLIYFIVVQVHLSPFTCHHFPWPHSPPPPTLNASLLWLCPKVLYTCSLTTLHCLFPIIPLSPSLWLLSVCSLIQYLCLYFVCLFVLLISFHL